MAHNQKHATPSKAQQEVIRKNGYNPALYTVLKDYRKFLLVRHRITGEVMMLDK